MGSIRIRTGNGRSILFFPAMRPDKYNRLSLLSSGLVGVRHFRSILIFLMKYFSNNRASLVLRNTIEQVGYILFVLVPPTEMYSTGSRPT